MSDPRIAWSADRETFNHDSLEELLDELHASDEVQAGRIVYSGECVPPRTVFMHAADVLEYIGDRAYDDGGEWAEDFPNVSAEAAAELESFLVAWQGKNCKPTWWGITNVKEYTVTADDLAALEPTP